MGEPLPDTEDIYAINGLPREAVKAWFSITFGIKKFHSKWPSETIGELRASCEAYKPSMTVSAVSKKVIEHFPIMAEWPESGLNWSNLMFIESEVIISTMQELMLKHQVPSLPVHDCIIVRESDEELGMKVLSKQFRKIVGIEPRLKVKQHQ